MRLHAVLAPPSVVHGSESASVRLPRVHHGICTRMLGTQDHAAQPWPTLRAASDLGPRQLGLGHAPDGAPRSRTSILSLVRQRFEPIFERHVGHVAKIRVDGRPVCIVSDQVNRYAHA